MGNRRRTFTLEERALLLSLDAVESVGESYIVYSEAFKAECMEAYKHGASPTQIFRRAGLDPKLIGHKRIERAVARWRDDERDGRFHSASGAAPIRIEEKRVRLIEEIRELEKRRQDRVRELALLEEHAKKRNAERRAS